MNTHMLRVSIIGAGLIFAAVSSAYAEQTEQVKENYHPYVNGSPVTLMKDNMLTQALGGRILNANVWAGEFVKFDDNIFNTKDDKKSDTIFSSAAGMLIRGEQKDVWGFHIEGQLQRNDYAQHNEFSGYEGFFHSSGKVDFSPALGAHVKFNFDSAYDNERNVEDIYLRRRVTTGAGLSVRPSPFFDVDVDYTYFAQRRDEEIVKDEEYDEHTITVRPSYSLTPNTTIYLQFDGTGITPIKRDGSAGSLAGLFGVAWSYMDTAKIIAEVGYKNMNFDTSHKIKDDTENYGSVIGRLRGEYSFTADWTAGLDFSYAPAYSAITTNAGDSNYVNRFISSAFLNYSPGAGRFTFSLRPFCINTEPSENDNYSEYGVNIGVSYVVTEWFNVNAGYTISAVKYEDEAAYSRNLLTLGAAVTF